MASLEELVVRLEADNAKLVAALEESAKVTARSSKQMEDAIQKFSESGSKSTSKFSGVMQVFAGTVLAQVATKAFSMVADAAAAMLAKFQEGIEESAQYEQSMIRLGNSLALSGNFSQKAMESLDKFNNTMEEYSGIDDAVVAGNLAMLSSMTKLDSEGLQRLQKAAIDLSGAMNIDLQTATKMVGKAANGETDAFKKLGINIQETGDKAGTLANTLRVLETRFGGAGGSAMMGFAGSMKAAENAVGNLFQSLGDVVTKNPAVLAAINKVTEIVNKMNEAVKGNADTLRKDFADAFATIIRVIAATGGAIEQFVTYVITGFKTIKLAGQSLVDLFQYIASISSFGNGAKAFKETQDQWDQLVQDTTEGQGKFSKALWEISDSVSNVADTYTGAATEIKTSVNNQKKDIQELTWLEETRVNKAREAGIALAEAAASTSEAYKMQQEALQLVYENQTMDFETFKAAKLASQADFFAQEQAQLLAAREAGRLTEEQYALASTQMHNQQVLAKMKLNQDLAKQEEAINRARLQGYSTFFGGLASLSQSSNRQLAEIGKAAAISQATIDAYLAIQNALATVPYPANIAAAAGIGIQAFANVSRIAGVGLRSGIDSVPGVGTQDNFPAMLAPGERVVPANTNQDLISFLEKNKEGGGQSAPTFNLNFYGPVWSDKASAGADIVEAINEALSRGMSLRLLNT